MTRAPLIIVTLAFALASCVAAGPEAALAPRPAETIELVRTGSTVAGQPIALPQGPIELVVSLTIAAPGGVVPMHRHRWPRYVRVEQGTIQLVFADGRPGRDYGPGDVIVEAIETWHEGRVVSREPARLLAFDLVPPGERNVVRRPG